MSINVPNVWCEGGNVVGALVVAWSKAVIVKFVATGKHVGM